MDTATEFTSMMYDWLSALQKEIRRGNEEEALYWAFELIERNCFTQCVNRLRVIAYEDIGVANLSVLPFVAQCLEDARMWYDEKKGHWPLAITDAVLALCRSDKCRDGDNAQIAVRGDRKAGKKLTIPDYAYDMHTKEGKAKGRGFKHFFEEAAKLNPDKSNQDYAERAKQRCLQIERGEIEDFFKIEYPGEKSKKENEGVPKPRGGLFD